ncbi:MAG TPA: methyl-accepting chemotaxis protein [Noviherbaspirillum sp.]|nr:methyl-accepting chemotaxis protein [Noviherbaspirillum sp.]
MFTNIKVGTRLIIGFLLLSLLGAAMGAIGIRNMNVINDKATELYQMEVMGISYIKEANLNLIYIDRGISNLLLATTPEERNRFAADLEKARRELRNNADKARPLFYSEQGKRLFVDFDSKLSEYEALIPDLIKRAQNEQLQENSEIVQYFFGTFGAKGKAIDDAITELTKQKEQDAKKTDDDTNQLYYTSRLVMGILVVGGALSGLALGLLITRSITRPLDQAVLVARTVAAGDLTSRIEVHSQDETGQLLQALKNMNDSLVNIVGEVRQGTDTIATASNQIAAGNLDLSSRTEEQASSLEETASSMEELTSTVKQNADNAQQANQLAVSASEVAGKGGMVVSQVVDTMMSINDSSKKIVDIIGVIDGIAFQTNILALNAAVEAARAGEQGRGFAVVASEVRNLAQRSAAAAKEIKTLIDNSVEKVDAGSKLVNQAGVTMGEIVESIKHVTDIMAEITAASYEQTSGIDQINQAVSQMDQVTQQNASLVEEAAAAAEAMQEQAANLAQVVSVFKLNGTQTAALAPAAKAPVARLVKTAAAPLPRKAAPKVQVTAAKPKRLAAASTPIDEEWEQF